VKATTQLRNNEDAGAEAGGDDFQKANFANAIVLSQGGCGICVYLTTHSDF